MAYNPIRINPLDFKPSTAIGIAIPFNTKNVFTLNYTTKDQIRSNLLNFFLTNPNERIFNVNFGGGLRNQIFESITNDYTDNIKESIQQSLGIYFPQINISELNVSGDKTTGTIYINISYSINDTNINDTINLELA